MQVVGWLVVIAMTWMSILTIQQAIQKNYRIKKPPGFGRSAILKAEIIIQPLLAL